MNARASQHAAHDQQISPHAGELVDQIRNGDDSAWTALMQRFDGMLRGIARSYRLCPADVDDAVQASWMRLYQHIDRLREPTAVGAWLATTTRREALALAQLQVREHLTDDPELGEGAERELPDMLLLAAEQRVVLGRALASLPDRQRQLMMLLAEDPNAGYRQISARLSMPIGSIGPVRARSLARLERHPELREHFREAC